MTRWIHGFVVSVAVAGVVASGFATSPAAAAIRRPERRLAALVNRARENRGLHRLQLTSRLSRLARAHSRDMAQRHYLFHSDLYSLIHRSGCTELAENVYKSWSVREIHQGFMGSAPHRHNILDPGDRRLGIGIVRNGNKLWATELFCA